MGTPAVQMDAWHSLQAVHLDLFYPRLTTLGLCIHQPGVTVNQRGATDVTPQPATQPSQRLLSLDVLRGLTVAVMILVNNAGDGAVSYAQLRHSAWNGCTLTDVVFPLFLFIVGVSVALAFQRRLDRGAARTTILLQVLQRALLIFVLGLVLNALPFFQLSGLRYYGVLQRIALCYLLASIVYLLGGFKASATVAVALLIGYWLLLTHVRVPHFGMPGVDVPLLDPVANLPAWLDRTLVPAAHLYHNTVYDPEGLLSTLPALGTTLLGVLAARVLQSNWVSTKRTLTLILCGLFGILAGLLWSHAFPFNKRLWTSSYVLFTAGIASTLLGTLHGLIDGPLRWRRGLTPFVIFGTNALFAYILSEVIAIILHAITFDGNLTLQQVTYRLLPTWLGPPPFVSLLYSVLFVAVCLLPTAYLYRHKIFLKI